MALPQFGLNAKKYKICFFAIKQHHLTNLMITNSRYWRKVHNWRIFKLLEFIQQHIKFGTPRTSNIDFNKLCTSGNGARLFSIATAISSYGFETYWTQILDIFRAGRGEQALSLRVIILYVIIYCIYKTP